MGPSNSQTKVASKASKLDKDASGNTPLSSTVPSKEDKQAGAVEKEKEPTQETTLKPAKLPSVPEDSSKEKGAS